MVQVGAGQPPGAGADRPATLVAPVIALAQVANACWKASRTGAMTATQAAEAIEELPRFFVTVFDIAPLADRALKIALSLDHPVYDCYYLALAEREAATLVTADRRVVARVVARVAGTPWAASVTDLAAWTPT